MNRNRLGLAARPNKSSLLRRRLAVVAALGALVFAAVSSAQNAANSNAAPAGAAGPFEVRLHRPARIGRRGRLTVTGEKHQVMQVRANGQMARDDHEDMRVRFQAVERVLAVNS